MCTCMAESLCYPPETITTMLTSYNLIQNKKLKKKPTKNKNIRALFLHVILLDPPDEWASLIAQLEKNPSAMQEAPVGFLGWEDPLEKGKARLPTPVFWPGEFHRLYSPWGHKVGHD